MTKTIGGKAKRIKRQARLFRRYVRWLVAFTQGPLLCGACSAGRPEDCSGWCANYHAGVTE
jgi:hypothetical protein